MNNVVLSLTGSAVAGALTLIPPAGWSPGVRRAYVVVPGVLVTAFGAVVLSKSSDGGVSVTLDTEAAPEITPEETSWLAQRLPVVARVAVPLGLGAVTCGFQAASLWIDAALERWLVRRGAAHPRRWMAILAVVASLGIDAVGDRATTWTTDERPAP